LRVHDGLLWRKLFLISGLSLLPVSVAAGGCPASCLEKILRPFIYHPKIGCKCKALQYPVSDCAFRLRCMSLFGRIFIKLLGLKTTKR